MIRNTIAIAAVVAMPSLASALTVQAENDYATALSMVTPADSLDLPGTWTAAPLTVAPDASLGGQYRSPYQTSGLTAPGYYTVGVGSTYSGTSNPAELALTSLSNSFSLLWGSPDGYNTLELYNGATLVGTILGSQFNIPAQEASFVSIFADNESEYFDSVKFYSVNQNAFEFANVSATPVPLPASGLLLVAGLGALAARARRKSSDA
ncbi:VPLPA-CTERM sorting domain-containing protein [Sedimentitalea arenosa]|jgi:hypothetical protein|uniref:VPLPA-CTERM sorting domain-containing protein n=1 Tax=Sedimentitalea arenosa TaxID=2798803 RepID=A0A8J7LVH7_9RHOB|nr:VPLPA-CTERM sorting domain-containing protein [Arenibacterium arenosum]MBJ6370926.1 VPLPA-CTERM sorting domain-containing protein [Arenibacterium arenosum]